MGLAQVSKEGGRTPLGKACLRASGQRPRYGIVRPAEAAGMARSFTRSCLVALAILALAMPALAQGWGSGGSVPQFRSDGPEADAYGRKDGYPMCAGLAYIDDLG